MNGDWLCYKIHYHFNYFIEMNKLVILNLYITKENNDLTVYSIIFKKKIQIIVIGSHFNTIIINSV